MSIFSKFFLTLFGNALPSWLRLYIARVEGDGGTIVDRNHTKEVYADVSDQIDYLLIANACDAGKLDVLYSFYAEEHPWYVDYIDRILDDGGTVERYAEVYNTYDDLESAGVGEDAFLWLSASSGKTGLLYRMGANTIVYDHEQRVTIDGGTTYLPGANARIVQQLVREDLYNDPSIIIPCASGKEGLLYSLLPAVETNTTLLDYHTGSAAAYSLRNLSTSTTNVVKVRRSGDNAELDFTASEVYNGTLEAWVVAGGGTEDGLVTTWYDQSGNGNNATQATAANQPQIVSSGTLVTENGKAALETVLSGAQGLVIPSLTINLSDFTSTVVTKFYSDSGAASKVFIINGDTFETLDYRYKMFTFAKSAFYIGGSDFGGSQNIVSFTFSDQQQLRTITPTNGYVDGVDVGAFSTAGEDLDFTATFNYVASTDVGRDRGAHTRTSEVILWTSDQSANRTGIEANINDYYNIYS